MAVFPDRIVLKNSTDSEAAIVAAIGSGGTDPITQGEIVVGLTANAAKFYTLDGNGNVISLGGTVSEVIDDLTPQLGGDLDVNGFYIGSASGGNVVVAPDTTGGFIVRGNNTDGSITLNCTANTHAVTIQSPPHSDAATYSLILPSSAGTAGQVLTSQGGAQLTWEDAGSGGFADPMTTDGDIIIRSGGTTTRLGIGSESQVLTVSSGLPVWAAATGGGATAIDDLTDVDTSTTPPTTGQALVWNGTNWVPTNQSGGGGAVDSVNGQTGVVVLDVADLNNVADLGDPYFNQVGLLLLGEEGANGSSTITDVSSHSNPVLVNNGWTIATAQKVYGNSSYYTGASLYFYDSDAFTLGASDFTLECWIRFDSVASGQCWISHQTSANSNTSFAFYWEQSTNELTLALGTAAGTSYAYFTGSWTPSANTWYHVAATRASGTVRLFVDGSQVGTDGTHNVTINNSSEYLTLGAYYSNGGLVYTLFGYIDELRLTVGTARYTSNFTPAQAVVGGATPTDGQVLTWVGANNQWEPATPSSGGAVDSVNGQTGVVELDVADLNDVADIGDPYFNQVGLLLLGEEGADGSSTVTDVSSYSNPIQVNNGWTIATEQKVYGNSSYDTGSNTLYFQDSDAFTLGANDFTLECWVRFNSVASGQCFVSHHTSASSNASFAFYWEQSTNELTLSLGTAAGTSYVHFARSWTPSANTWYHLAATRASDTVRLFVDGTQIGADGTHAVNIHNSSEYLTLGAYFNSGGFIYTFNGYMDELRLTVGTARYTSNFTPAQVQLGGVAPADGQVLTWVDANSRWEPANVAGGGSVASVNNQTGAVSLGIQDMDDYSPLLLAGAVSMGTYNATNGSQGPDVWYMVVGQNFLSYSINTAGGLFDSMTLLQPGDEVTLTYGSGLVETRTLGTEVHLLNSSPNNYYLRFTDNNTHAPQVDETLVFSSSRFAGATPIALVDGQTLVWNAADSKFNPGEVGAYTIDDLTDVDTSTAAPTDGQVLTWVDANSRWEPAGVASGATELDGLTDVTTLQTQSGTANWVLNFEYADGTTSGVSNEGAISYSNFLFNSCDISTDVAKFGTASVDLRSAFAFNSSDTLSTAEGESLAFGTGDFTVEQWVYWTTVRTTSLNIVSMYGQTTASSNWRIFWNGVNNVFDIRVGSTTHSTSVVSPSDNTWHHVAMTRVSGVVKFFFDGVEILSAANTDSVDENSGYKLFLGGGGNSGENLGGYMDGFRVVKGGALYTAAFTPPTEAPTTTLTQGPVDGDILTWVAANSQWEPSAPVVGATVIDELTDVDTTGAADGNALTYVVSPPVVPSGEFVVTAAGGTISDISANALTITNNNSVGVASDGVTGDCIDFSTGASAYLSVADDPAFDFASGDFTIEFHFKYTTGGSAATITPISKRSGTAASANAFYITIQSSGNISVALSNGANNTFLTAAFGTRTEGVWYHVACVLDGDEFKIYKDGVKINTLSFYTSFVNSITAPLRLGATEAGTSGDFKLDNVRISKTAVYPTDFTPPTDFPSSPASAQWEPAAPAVDSNTTVAGTGSNSVSNIVTISQVDYDALATPDAGTLYFIV